MKRTHLILKLQVSETFHKRFQTSSQGLCKALRGQCREKETRRRERRGSKCVISLWSNYHCSFVKIILRCFIKRDRLLFCSRANLHLHSAVASSKIPTRSRLCFTTLCKKTWPCCQLSAASHLCLCNDMTQSRRNAEFNVYHPSPAHAETLIVCLTGLLNH